MNVLRYDEGRNVMRQKKEIVATIIIVLSLVIALISFAIFRSRSPHEEMTKHETHGTHTGSHEHADTKDHPDMGQLEHGEHADSEYELSGELVNGIRIIKIKARRFEFDPSKMVVKAGEKIRLEVTSEDVVHGIEIKDFSINRELKPHKTEVITFTAHNPGSHHFHCSVYCGTGHGDMHGELIVLEES